MITDEATVAELRKSTADLIEHEGMDITLVRSGFERTAEGGIRRAGSATELPVRRFFSAITADPRYVVSDTGERLRISHVLVGLHTDDIREKDTFSVGDRKFLVRQVDPDRTYQTRGWCIEDG